ncbi:MAG: peptidoglycan DD-metalloendopeptidase family protein [Sideroxydans sp.]|nr:peptidoglycan DD-metalloendopeptidase family protein [Sideroxydans sp.]
MILSQLIKRLRQQRGLYGALLVALWVSACGAPAPVGKPAPVEEYGGKQKKSAIQASKSNASTVEKRSKLYTVQKGDTLYSIAFQNGVDVREVAELNNLKDPSAISIGQQLKLNVPVTEVATKVDAKPSVAQQLPPLGGVRNQPKVGRLTYSPDALAKAGRMQEEAPILASATPSAAPVTSAKPTAPVIANEKDDGDDEELEWGMPTQGKVAAGFSETDNRKGVDIVGKRGQVIVASAPGKVVYSGSGLRGYGKLIIIKHNKTYLSAYAHNDQVLVKEGQAVKKGQKIAEMGNTDSDQVKLHFEIRKLGKPVDPAKFLPLIKS